MQRQRGEFRLMAGVEAANRLIAPMMAGAEERNRIVWECETTDAHSLKKRLRTFLDGKYREARISSASQRKGPSG